MPRVTKSTQTTSSDLLIAVQLRLNQLQEILQQRNSKIPENFPAEDDKNTISIGSNQTKVHKAILSKIDWQCYSLATRKLLDAVFDKRTLATSSICGRSPRSKGRPLDPQKISDIIEIIKRKCKVHEVQIRKIIMIKCCDTARSKKFKSASISPKVKTCNKKAFSRVCLIHFFNFSFNNYMFNGAEHKKQLNGPRNVVILLKDTREYAFNCGNIFPFQK